MQVLEPQPILLQADLMIKELDACSKREYTEKSLPILLHQYFVDRMYQLVVLKHSHLLRWKRYCSSTAAVESIYSEYLNRLEQITKEYLDSSSRAHRLASTREGLLANSDYGIEDVSVEDYQIYLKHMISHLQSLSYINQVLNIIKWLPYSHRDKIKESLKKTKVDSGKEDHSLDDQGQQDNAVFDKSSKSDEKVKTTLNKHTDKEGKPNYSYLNDDDDNDGDLFTGQKDSNIKVKENEAVHETTGNIPTDTGTGTRQDMNDENLAQPLKEDKNKTKLISFVTDKKSITVHQKEAASENKSTSSSPQQPQCHFHFAEHIPQPPVMMQATVMTANGPLLPNKANLLLAATGGGITTDEKSSGLPLHANDLETLRPHLILLCYAYNIQMNVSALRSSADEMELFSVINRRFRHIFNRQDEMLNFRTYDHSKTVGERWGLDTWVHAVKKTSNWLPYVKLKPRRDEYLVRMIMELRCSTTIDDLLLAASNFLQIRSAERVQQSLRHHAMLVQHPPMIHTASVVSHKRGQSTIEIFKKIYTNPELYSSSFSSADGKNKSDDYDFVQAMQMLGLDDAGSGKDDPTSVQGAYLSFLHLRHLKLRDLMRTCISVLNYFRSIERTLTINDQGLSMSAKGSVERTSPPNHRVGVDNQGHQGGGNTLNAHGYLFNTPHEFKIKEIEFMQFADIENHDDFYYHEEERIHVRDQIGYWIVYDCALDDFRDLERDILLIATSFIQKDRAVSSSSNVKRKPSASSSRKEDFDIALYAHREVDRFGVLYDIWSNETAFQEAKKSLMDIYLEAYNHVISRESRRRLAQMMTDLMFKRPRIDFSENYFVKAYRYECAILRQRTEVMRSILTHQILNEREYLKKVCTGKPEFGLPPPLIEKFLIAPSTDEPVLCPIYLLEFHSSLACTPSIIEAIDESVLRAFNVLTPESQIERIKLEKRFFDYLKYEIDTLKPLGASYTAQIQRDLFSSYFIEDAIQMSELCNQYLSSIQQRNSRGDKKTRQIFLLNELGRLLDLITVRHRLIDCMWECEILSKIYLNLSYQMGYDDFHLFIRPLQFESAKYKEGAEDLRPPVYITAIQDDDSPLDKYLPSALPLAIHELDETHVGKFSFRGKVTIMEMLETRGVENLLTVLKVQTAHKNALIASILLAYNACPAFYTAHAPKVKNGVIHSINTGVNLMSYNGLSGTQVGPTPLALERSTHQMNADYHPEAYFSIQLEKGPSRDRMQNAFIKRTQGGGIASSKSTVESEKMKREFLSQYCLDFGQRTQQASLRAQIIETYSSILIILKSVPTVSEEFFIIGYAFEKKSSEDDLDTQTTDPRSLRSRPRRVLSTDGKKCYNLWFIPHFIEVLFVFRHLDDEACTKALRSMSRIARALHDILHYLIAYARLGISSSRITPEQRHRILVTSDENQNNLQTAEESAIATAEVAGLQQSASQLVSVGTTESMSLALSSPASSITPLDLTIQGRSLIVDQLVATELREIQYQINRLPDPTDPEQIIEVLSLRRDIMFLKFDVCIRTVLGETFLAAGNEEAFKEVKENSHFPLAELSNMQRPCVNAIDLCIPEPMEPRDDNAQAILPWRCLINYYGPYLLFNTNWTQIDYNIRLCLAGLKPVDRPTVHGELLAMNLTLEDILETGDIPEACAGDKLPIQQAENMHCMLGKRTREKRRDLQQTPGITATTGPTMTTQTPSTEQSTGKTQSISPNLQTATSSSSKKLTGVSTIKLSTLDTPIAAYELIKKCLILWKRVELLKYAWGKRRLGIERINTPSAFKMFCSIYKREKLYPLLRNLSIQYRQPDMYSFGPLNDSDIFVMPKNIPEIVVRQRQLLKLIEAFEFFMISDLRKLVVRQTDLVIKERNREEGNLPLDLWKRPAMKESLTVPRPALAEEFLSELLSHTTYNEKTDVYILTKKNFNDVIQNVAISVMRNERESFEHYSMYYENLLKNQHSIIYANEREIQDLKDQLHQKDLETGVTVQFQMSEQAHNLLLEVTALRARIHELEEINSRNEAKARKHVRNEFNNSIRKLFGLSFEQKSRIDEYRNQLHAITLQRIAEVRDEASTEMSRIKERGGVRASAEDELAERNNRLFKEVTALHERNISLQQMIGRLRVMAHWQQTTLRCIFEKQIDAIEDQRNQSKTRVTRLGILSEQRVRLLNEEMAKVREHLANTEKHLNNLRNALDKEMKDKVEKKHAAERKAATDKQMTIVKQMHIDQLMAEITEKDAVLNEMSGILDASAKSKKQEADKSGREVEVLRKQLKEEKQLKKSAIQKIDDLMSQLYEFEANQAISSGTKQKPMSASPSSRLDIGQTTGNLRKMHGDKSRLGRPVTHDGFIKRNAIPYTYEHYTQFRNKMVGIPSLRERLADRLLRNGPPDKHSQLIEMQKQSASEQ
nr:unnamed protein product [Trichobilharzia regenti]